MSKNIIVICSQLQMFCFQEKQTNKNHLSMFIIRVPNHFQTTFFLNPGYFILFVCLRILFLLLNVKKKILFLWCHFDWIFLFKPEYYITSKKYCLLTCWFLRVLRSTNKAFFYVVNRYRRLQQYFYGWMTACILLINQCMMQDPFSTDFMMCLNTWCVNIC